MRKYIQRIVPILIALTVMLLCLRYVISHFQWQEAIGIVRQANLWLFFAVSGVTTLICWAFRALRWHVLLRRLGTDINLVDLYLCCAVALSLSIITPFQSGEMLKVELLKKHAHISRFTEYSSFLVERAADLLVVVTLGTIGIVVSLNQTKWHFYLCAIAIIASLVTACGLLALKRIPLWGKLREFIGQIRQCMADLPTLPLVLFWTILGWGAVAACWMACLRSISVNITIYQCFALMALVTLAGVFSFIPGGLGIAEAGTARILAALGYSAVSGQAGSIILRGYSLLLMSLGAMHYPLWRFSRSSTDPAKGGKIFPPEKAVLDKSDCQHGLDSAFFCTRPLLQLRVCDKSVDMINNERDPYRTSDGAIVPA